MNRRPSDHEPDEVYARLCFSMIYVDINGAIFMLFLGVLFPICSRTFFPIFGMNPVVRQKIGHTLQLSFKASSYLLAGEGAWERGRRLSPLPQIVCRSLLHVLTVLIVHNKLHGCAWRGCRISQLALLFEFLGGSVAQG